MKNLRMKLYRRGRAFRGGYGAALLSSLASWGSHTTLGFRPVLEENFLTGVIMVASAWLGFISREFHSFTPLGCKYINNGIALNFIQESP